MVPVVFYLRSRIKVAVLTLFSVSAAALFFIFFRVNPSPMSASDTTATTATVPVVVSGDLVDVSRFSPFVSLSVFDLSGVVSPPPVAFSDGKLSTEGYLPGTYRLDFILNDGSTRSVDLLVLPPSSQDTP